MLQDQPLDQLSIALNVSGFIFIFILFILNHNFICHISKIENQYNAKYSKHSNASAGIFFADILTAKLMCVDKSSL